MGKRRFREGVLFGVGCLVSKGRVEILKVGGFVVGYCFFRLFCFMFEVVLFFIFCICGVGVRGVDLMLLVDSLCCLFVCEFYIVL